MLQAADSLWPLCILHTLSADHCRESVLHCNICAGTVWLSVYVVVWEPVSKQKRLLVLAQKQWYKFRNLFFFKDIFIYYINSEELKYQNLVAFFVCFLKIQLWKEAKISSKSVPICYTSKLTVLFVGVKYFFQKL